MEIRKFVEKVHEDFPQIKINNMLVIWREQQGIPFCTFGGFEFPKDEFITEEEQEKKICQHICIKVQNANTQCTTKVKRKGHYCSKHSKT
jgi:hypothetical protein